MSFPRLQNLLTAPNLLSLSRIPLGVAFWFALGPADVLDGYLARRLAARAAGGTGAAVEPGGGTGAWLDPICDKLFVGSVLAAIMVRRQPPIWVVLLILSRELAQLPIGVVYRFLPTLRTWLRYDFRASVLGKGATVAQFIAIAALILNHRWIRLFAFLAFVLGLGALVDYFRRAVAMGKSRHEAESARGAPVGRP
jgi:phosphatidylglycerophosphate synthase